MKNILAILALMSMLVVLIAGCGSTPTPTSPPPTPTQPQPTPTQEAAPTQPPPPTPTTEAAAPAPTEPPPPTPTTEAAAPAPTEPPTTAPEPTLEPTTEPTSPPKPTTPLKPSVKYPPPTLLNPPDGVPISWNYSVLMEWSDVGELEEDEYYHLHLDGVREVTGEPWYGDYIYTKETSYRAEEAFLAPFHPPQEQGRAVVSWWVRVVRKTGVGKDGKPVGVDIGTPSEKRTFITESKPNE